MGGISGLVSNALTGLEAAQQGLQVTGNNIANVNTPGYNNQSLIQVQQNSTLLGAGYALGNGTAVQTVERSYNGYLQGQVWSSTAAASGASTYNTQLQAVVNLIAGTNAGLSSSINNFFASGVAQVAANPSDLSARQALLNQAQGLTSSFQNAATILRQASAGVNQQIAESVSTINSLTSQIAQLNVQIGTYGATGTPNSLLDQRNQLITELSGQVGVNVLQQGSQVNVYTGNGQILVAGNQSFSLAASGNAYDPAQYDVAYQSNGEVISQSIQGGALGGLLQFRSQVLQPAQDALGQIADGVAQAINDQQAKGLDLTGVQGTAMFAAGGPQVLANAGNAGNYQLSASLSNASGLANQVNYMAKYDGSAWTITNASTGAFVTSGASLPMSFGGVTLASGSGTAAAGDTFEIEPTRYGALNFRTVLTAPTGVAAAAPYVSSTGAVVNGSLVNANLGNMVLSAGGYAATSGSAAVSGGSIGSPPQPITITMTGSGTAGDTVGFTATQNGATVFSGTVTLGSSGSTLAIPYASNPPGGYWNVTLSGGTAASGDAFTLSAGGPGNGNNAQAMAALQNAGVLDGGTTSVQAAYTQLASQVASQGNLAQSSLSAATAIATQAKSAQQSASGVNLDQQATMLMQYQQAYQAAATAIQIGNTLFNSLLQAI